MTQTIADVILSSGLVRTGAEMRRAALRGSIYINGKKLWAHKNEADDNYLKLSDPLPAFTRVLQVGDNICTFERKEMYTDNVKIAPYTPVADEIDKAADQEQAFNEDKIANLATVTTINSVRKVPDSDNLDVVTFTTNGWEVVMGRNSCKVGDRCVFFELDAWLPKEERYSILEGRSNKALRGKEGYRIKSIKLRGQISQGYAVALTEFPELNQSIPDGTDVGQQLGIKKYMAPVFGGFGFNIGQRKGNFIGRFRKTDQENLQSFGIGKLMQLYGHTVTVEEKLDGTSFTCGFTANSNFVIGGRGGRVLAPHERFIDWQFHVCSRNLELKEPIPEEKTFRNDDGTVFTKTVCYNSVYWDMARKYKLEERLGAYCKTNGVMYAISSEIIGPGIQKNKYRLTETEMRVFDVYDVEMSRYLSPIDRRNLIAELNTYEPDAPPILEVPVIAEWLTFAPSSNQINAAMSFVNDMSIEQDQYWTYFMTKLKEFVVSDALTYAEGASVLCPEQEREGLVWKCHKDAMISWKTISNKFLFSLKEK